MARDLENKDPAEPSDQTIAHFRDHGWMRVAQAFSEKQALAMRSAAWRILAERGIDRKRRSTWTVECPAHLQQLKNDPVFQAIGSMPLLDAMASVLDGRSFEVPKDWGACFITFPTAGCWSIPTNGWHIDAKYTSALWPMRGVKTHALFSDVAPQGGGTLILSGSHRLIHQWYRDNPPPPGARSAEMRKRLQSHPFIRDLHADGDKDARIARFMGRAERVDGVPLQVIENSGRAGDVLLLHPLVLHVAAPNRGTEPRFLLSGGVTTDQWGWGG